MADSEVSTELTATQYVILAENQRKKKALAETKAAASKLADENQTLVQKLEAAQKESYEVAEHLRKELLAKTEKIAELEDDIVKRDAAKEEALARLTELAKEREAKLLADAHVKQRELSQEIERLETELRSVLEFKSRQVEIEEELLRLKEENQELKEKLEAQRTELERYYLELNTRMRKEYEQRLEELKKSAEEEIDERLDASVKRILQQNRRMAEELKLHVQETDVLQQEVRILEEERARLQREVTLKTEMEEGYAKRGAKQQGAIKEAQAKIASLEASLAGLVGDFDAERKALMRSVQQQVDDARAESDALRRLVKLKTRELKNVRRLAQEVLLQRSDVETFLLSSLHMVRKNIEKAAVMSMRPGSGGSAKGGSRDGTPGADPLAGGSGGAVEIKDLAWEDRERVLRLLFAKINNQAQQVHYTNLPAHPLESQVAGSQVVQVTQAGLQGIFTDAGPAGIV